MKLPQTLLARIATLALGLSITQLLSPYSAQAASYTWDGGGLNPTAPAGGAGTWNTSGLNWSDGANDNAWGNTGSDVAVFGGTAGAVTLSGSLNALGVQFLTTGYTLSSGTLVLGASGIDASSLSAGTTTISSPVILGAGQSWNTGTGANLAVSGIVSGTSALTTAGGGTLTLSGLNTFSGGLTISSGTVAIAANTVLGGAGGTAGAVTLNGGTLRVNLGSTNMTNTHVITVGTGGGTIMVNSTASPTYNIGTAGNLTGAGNLSILGNGVLTQAASAGASVFVVGVANTGFTGNLTLGNGAVFEDNNVNAIATSGTFIVNSLGMLSANSVTIAQTVNVNDNGYLAFQNAATGVFSGPITLSGSTNVRMQNWWSAATQNGAITGNIGGTGSLNLNSGSGSGATLTVSGTNTYSGGTTVSAAILKATKSYSLPGITSAGKVSIGSTSTLSVSAGGTGEFAGSDLDSIASNVSFANGATLAVDTTNASATVAQTANFATSGTLNLTKAGVGTLSLGGSNAFFGNTTISAGAIQLNNANALLNSAVTVSAANGLAFGSGVGTFTLGSLAGTVAEALTDTASSGVTLTVGGNNTGTTYSGVLSGAGGITKNGTGTLNLNAVNTYSGATIVNGGAINVAAANPSNGIASSDLTVNSGASATFGGNSGSAGSSFTDAKSVTLNGGSLFINNGFRGETANITGNLTLGPGSNVVAVNGNTNGGFGNQVIFGGSLVRGAGTTVLLRGKNMGGSTNVNSNATSQPQNIRITTAPTNVGGGGSLSTTTTSIVPYAIGDNGYNTASSLYLTSGLGTDFVAYNPTGGAGAGFQLLTTYANTISSGSTALINAKIVDGSSTGINTATTINSLILSSTLAAAGSPGTSSVDGTGTLTVNSGALLVTTSSPGTSGGNYGGLFQNNATIGASGLTLDFGSNEAIVTVTGSSTLTMASTSGGITGSGGLTKSGAGDLNLNAAGTLSGNVVINAGRIVLGHSNALQNSTLNYNNQGGSLSFGALSAATLAGLNGSQNLALSNTSAGNVALTVGSNNVTSSYSGVLSGGGSLTKAGTGTFTLTGSNTYAGSTTINGGSLKLAGASLGNTSSVAVNGGGTLIATGALRNTISGLVTLAGSSIAAGQGSIDLTADASSATVLNLNGGLTLGGGSAGAVSELYFDLAASGSNADLIKLGSGALTGNAGGAVINIGSVSLNSAVYTLLNYGSVSGITPGTNLTVGTHPSQLFTSYTLSLTNTSGAGSLLLTVAGTPVPNLAYWTGGRGGSYNWGDNDGISLTNWSTNQAGTTDAGQIAGANSDVVFAADNASAGSLNTNLETNYSVNSVTVLGSGAAASTVPVISGSGKLTLNANASGAGSLGYSAGKGIVLNSGAAGLTINTTGGVALASNQSWTNNSSNALTVASNVNGQALTGGTTTLTLDGSGSGTTLVSGTIGDGTTGGKTGLAVNRTGTGPVLLSGSNTYTGATTITSGVLQPQTASAIGSTSGITVDSGGALELQGGLAIGNTPLTLNGTGNSLSPAGALRNVSGNNSYAGLLALGSDATIESDSGTLAVSNAGTITGSGKNLTLTGAGNGTLASIIGTGAGGLIKNGAGTWTLSGVSTYTGTTAVNAGTLSISGNNNLGGTSAPVLLNGGTVTTTAGITNTHPFTIGANGGTINVTTTGQYFFNTANTLLGSGTLTLTGTGNLVANTGNFRIAQTNTFNGTVALQNGGILEYGVAGAVDSAAGIILNNQSELSVNTVTMPNSLTVNGGNNTVLSFENGTTGVFSGPISLNADLTVGLRDWFNNATARGGTISGNISGNANLNVNSGSGSGGTLTLSGSNTYTGNTTVTASTLTAAKTYSLPNYNTAGKVSIGSTSTLALNVGGTNEFASSDIDTVLANVSFASGAALGLNTTNAPGGIFTYGSSLAGTQALTKLGTGTLALTGANTFSGATTISAGILQFSDPTQMSSSSALTIGSGGTLSLVADADTTFTPASLNLTTGATNNFMVNALTTGSNHTLTIANNAAVGNGNTTINVSGTTGDTLKFNSSFGVSGNGSSAWGGPVTSFNLSGADVILNGMNTTDGLMTVSSTTGNTLTINGGVSSPAARTIGATVSSGALTLNDTFTGGTSGINWGFFVNLNGGTLNVNTATAINNNSAIAGTRAGLAITGGTLNNTSGAAVTISTNPTVLFNGDFAFSNSAGNSLNNLSIGTGAVNLGPNAGTTRTITTNGSATLTVGGAVSNGTTANSLTKAGTGSLALTGISTYTGTTSVTAGTLIVGGALNGSTDVEVGALGKLQLNTSGLITTSGTVNVNGILSLNGGQSTAGKVVMNNGSTFDSLISGTTASTHASISTTGGFSLATDGAGVTLSLNTASYTPTLVLGDLTQSDHFVLTLGNGTASTGAFANVASVLDSNYGLTLNEFTDASGHSWAVFYNVDSTATNPYLSAGNDLVVYAIAVPEPSTWAMMIGGLGMLVSLQRARRRKL